MLGAWDDDSAFAFGTHGGETRHPLALYLTRFLYLYEQARATPDSLMLDIYHAVMDVLARIARRQDDTTILKQLLDTPLLERLHQAIHMYEAMVPAPTGVSHPRLYQTYIRPYFVERAS